MNISRTNGTVEIDALAEPTDDGRVRVSIAVIRDGVLSEEPWYEDILDECTSADLAALADEALAAHS